MRVVGLCLLCCMGAIELHAEENVWQSNVEFGFVQTSGNTQTKTLNTKVKISREVEATRTTLEASALNASDQNRTTAKRLSASLQEDWKFSERGYVIGRLSFSTDRFAGIQSRYKETVGYGRQLAKNEAWNWKFELGVGARQTQLIPTQRKNDVIGRSATAVQWKMSDHSKLLQELDTEGGQQGFVSHSVTALQQQINDTLSSKIAFSAEHTSKVPATIKKLNTETSVTLVWAY